MFSETNNTSKKSLEAQYIIVNVYRNQFHYYDQPTYKTTFALNKKKVVILVELQIPLNVLEWKLP